MRRPQFTVRALLVVMLAVGCFFAGIRFERVRRRREDKAAELAARMQRNTDALRRLLPGNPVGTWESELWRPRPQLIPYVEKRVLPRGNPRSGQPAPDSKASRATAADAQE